MLSRALKTDSTTTATILLEANNCNKSIVQLLSHVPFKTFLGMFSDSLASTLHVILNSKLDKDWLSNGDESCTIDCLQQITTTATIIPPIFYRQIRLENNLEKKTIKVFRNISIQWLEAK